MQSKGNAPTAAQKRWREAVRDLGSIMSGGPAVVHHAVGCSGKHNKVAIGHWWLIPLTDEEHKALHAGETFGHDSRKEFEKHEFCHLVDRIYGGNLDEGNMPPVSAINAIMDYHR